MSDTETTYDRLARAADAVAEAQRLLAVASYEVAMALTEVVDNDGAHYAIYDLARRLSEARWKADTVPLRRQTEWTGGGLSDPGTQSKEVVTIALHRIYRPSTP